MFGSNSGPGTSFGAITIVGGAVLEALDDNSKIVERREHRQREQAEQQAVREERFRQFEEWRKQHDEYEKEKKKPRLV